MSRLLRECSPKQSALELLAMGAGIYLMYLVLVLEAYLDGRAEWGCAPSRSRAPYIDLPLPTYIFLIRNSSPSNEPD